MKLLQMADHIRFARMTTEELRETFLLQGMFTPGALELTYLDLDRTVLGGAVPLGSALYLSTAPELKAEYFCERRELGILNVGGAGSVSVDGQKFVLSKLDCLYVGRGSREILFESDSAECPAAFYLLSYLAHADFPTALVRFADLQGVSLGNVENANKRTLYKAIHLEGVHSCQLVMGFTLLEPGSVWNTMPPHTHMRRSEVYMYFDLDLAQRVMHLAGPPEETRHLIVADREIVVSPGWGVHAGVGTASYAFCWGMGGENQRYDDMDPVTMAQWR